jgi:hypothetical protein
MIDTEREHEREKEKEKEKGRTQLVKGRFRGLIYTAYRT